MVFADIMSQALLDPEMLSCTEMPTSRLPSSLVELRSAVDSTNEILHTLRDILVLSLREPIDQSFIKAELPTFWSKLVSNRVRGIKRFFRAGLGTESELVDNLLTPLIPELVTWERVALKENMSWNFDCGDEPRPLREFSFQENRPPPVAVLHFLDELARQRDALFQDHRKSWWPKHEEVGKGFPRGLAVQQLLPTWECFGFALQNRGHAPYITGRIMDVLEANPETVLAPVPSDDDIVNAYIDSMSFVIRAHLSLFPSKKAKNEALIRLWEKYAARQEEYGEYFPVLQTLMLSGIAEPLALYSAARVIRPPRLPQPSYLWMERESDEILEWDPAGEACNKNLPARDDRSLPETLLYLRLVGDYCDRYNYIVPEARSLDVLHDPHWPWPNIRYSPLNRELVRKMSPASRDAVIMSALLYLDSIATYTPNRLLTTSFPSSDSQRAPPMRLAAEFTKTAQENNGGKGMKRALWVLGSSIKSVPASLLRDLTITYLDCLQALQKIDPMFAPLMRATFKLIRLLVQSDVPELAVDVVCRVIETYPDESTYYRHMKLLTLGRRLHPEAAATFMDCFAGFVCSKLVEQKQAKPASQPEGQAFVKITTVKFLAETLGEADFLPTDTILQIFTRLVNSSHHVDIRAAVAKSTLGLLTRVGGTAFDNVYGFLSSLADTAAGPSEKDPVPGREAWKTSLPTVSPSTNRPTLSLLLKNAFEAIPPGRREKYASEILIPLIESSRDQHTYWMDIFLSSIGLSRNDPDIQIPNFGPFDPRISDTVFRIWGTYLPPNFLTEHHRNWALTPIHHHAAYQHITNTLETKNPGYRQTNSGTHWNEIATLVKSTNPLTSLDLLLFSSKGPEIENGITLSIVAREFKYRLGLLARNPIQYYRKLDKFVVSISPVIRALRGVRGYRAGSDNMNEADRAKRYNELDWILRWVVDDIQCLDGSGPPILPSQLEMQALLLPSPAYLKPVGDKLELFVSEVTRLLRRWIEDPVLVLEFDVVVRIVQEVRKEDAIVVADMLAGEQVDLESIREIEFCLRVRLAKGLLDRVGDSDLRLSALVRSIVGRWRESQNQFVKRTGWEVLI